MQFEAFLIVGIFKCFIKRRKRKKVQRKKLEASFFRRLMIIEIEKERKRENDRFFVSK
jgi:hypothetical protein